MYYTYDLASGAIRQKTPLPPGPFNYVEGPANIKMADYWVDDQQVLQPRTDIALSNAAVLPGESVLIWAAAPECSYVFKDTYAHAGGDLSVSITEEGLHHLTLIGQYRGTCTVEVRSLDGWKEHYLAKIDAENRSIEAQIVTIGQTMQDRYRRKAAQAALARARLEAGDPLDPVETPLIAGLVAEIQKTLPAYDPMTKIAEIEANAAAWVPLDDQVENLRDAAKTLVHAATTLTEIQAAADVAWPISP